MGQRRPGRRVWEAAEGRRLVMDNWAEKAVEEAARACECDGGFTGPA